MSVPVYNPTNRVGGLHFSTPSPEFIVYRFFYDGRYDQWASFIAQLLKNPPAMQETPVQFLGWEDSLEKGKATHSCILAWRIP